jgi:hypothetical protein
VRSESELGLDASVSTVPITAEGLHHGIGSRGSSSPWVAGGTEQPSALYSEGLTRGFFFLRSASAHPVPTITRIEICNVESRSVSNQGLPVNPKV